jgi:hypothetical protein
MCFEGSQFLVYDGADVDKNRRQKLLRGIAFKEQQIRHGARHRYNGPGDMPMILMGILAKVGVHRIRFHLTHDILDLRDRFAMTLELRILIASKKTPRAPTIFAASSCSADRTSGRSAIVVPVHS